MTPKAMLEVWAHWSATQDERGWPSESVEVRAIAQKAAATNTNGIARYRGTVDIDYIDANGNACSRKIATLPPPMPKGTRNNAVSRMPLTDQAKLGPQVNRFLLDLIGEGGIKERTAYVLILETTFDNPVDEKAQIVGLRKRTYRETYKIGLEKLDSWMKGVNLVRESERLAS